MIVLQTEFFKIDLSKYGVTLKEKSSLFTDNIYESYSLPFVIPEASDIINKLGLPTLNNIINLKTSISGKLIFHDRFFICKFYIKSHKNKNLSCSLSFGDNKPQAFDVKLSNLGWENILTPDFNSHASGIITQSWPDVSHQFPMIYKPSIKETTNYEKFEGFINNYDEVQAAFVSNSIEEELNEDEELIDVVYNRNVMMPCVYLVEILKKGYKFSKKEVLGEFINDEMIQKITYKPKNFINKLDASQFQSFSFGNPDPNNPLDDGGNYYIATFNATEVGSYKLKLNFNIPSALVGYFKLTVRVNNSLIKKYESSLSRVNINEDLKINLESTLNSPEIRVEMNIPFTTVNMQQYNAMEFSFEDGKLNILPSFYNLSDFMPDMTFGEFVNLIKNWFNLDIKNYDGYVMIDFLENNITNRKKTDHEHLKVDDAEFLTNENKVYELKYANDEKVTITKEGQIYNDVNRNNTELVEILTNAKPLISEFNEGILTAFDNGNDSGFDFVYYDGSNLNRVPSSSELSLQKIHDLYWTNWLKTRIISKTVKDSFKCSSYEIINKDEISKKYNEFIFPKEINKRYEDSETINVTIEGETL